MVQNGNRHEEEIVVYVEHVFAFDHDLIRQLGDALQFFSVFVRGTFSCEPTSIVTGKGIVCNVQSVASLAAGDELVIDGAGKLEKPTNDDTDRVVAIALAATFAGVGTDGVANNFTKVLLI